MFLDKFAFLRVGGKLPTIHTQDFLKYELVFLSSQLIFILNASLFVDLLSFNVQQ